MAFIPCTIERQVSAASLCHSCKVQLSIVGKSTACGIRGAPFLDISIGVGKGVFWKRGLFKNVHFLEILENLENLEILETPQSVENKGECDHFLEIPENLEILEIPPVKSLS